MTIAKIAYKILVFGALTILTQLGGIAYLIAQFGRRRFLLFLFAYGALSLLSVVVAPVFGRVPLSCFGPNVQMASPLFCALNRQYVSPDAKAVVEDLSHHVTGTTVLDANFPFFDGFPLLPHLSHDDGRKVDIALYYEGPLRSPFGYFAFEQGPTGCSKIWATLRWDLDWLQPIFPDVPLDEERTRRAIRFLAKQSKVEKLFVETHLQERLGLSFTKVRFQGCRAARHDDHIHFQVH